MKMEKTVKFLAVLTTVASLTAEGAEWHVNHEWGDDNWPGTAAQPFKTFKHALLKRQGLTSRFCAERTGRHFAFA